MYLNEILPGKWREDEWPEHIEVSHEASRFKSRRCSAAHLFPCTRCTHLTTCDRTTGTDVYSADADWCGEFEEA